MELPLVRVEKSWLGEELVEEDYLIHFQEQMEGRVTCMERKEVREMKEREETAEMEEEKIAVIMAEEVEEIERVEVTVMEKVVEME